jgi:Fe-Mn family superoxide dismutase
MLTRRDALKTLTATAIASTALNRLSSFAADPAPPPIDAETMHLHHDKHHAAYVNKLNEALAKEPSFTPPVSVDELVSNLSAVPQTIQTAVRNQGGGHSNHSLFWQTLSAKGGAPKEAFEQAITDDAGGFEKMKADMDKAGAGLFGSGWVWLVLDGGKKLTILTLPNQDSPLTEGHYPLFGIDVWEHAYYLKYHNVRADYIKAIWSVVNWDFISDRYDAAMK